MLILIAIGMTAWRQVRSLWLLLGSVTMLFTAAAGTSILWLGNFGELVLYASIVATMFQVAAAESRSAAEGANDRPESGRAAAQSMTVRS